ncbi:cell division protein FtsQ/DivIB [uncultured Moraxella sp.]|uniref:cell division protein FtsQ/DivIB n=1 Tax=uncultured Moraxella sp. TaxID=263769 RepID=UPI0025FD9EB8|nr:cell division protein FtsQ/DivIB [uncultured Moraxella sp.]
MINISTKAARIKPWQLQVFAVFCVAMMVALLIYLANNTKPNPIGINPTGLSDQEVAALEAVVSPLGNVQFFGANLSTIHQTVSELSWVESASVYRDWNKGIMVTAKPRIAVANFGSEQMLDGNGVVFTPADPKAVMNKSLANLYSRPSEALDVMKQMRRINGWFAPLNLHAVDMILTPRQTWVIVFDNGMRVIVDHEDTEQKLYQLSTQLASNLKADLPKITSVDLRYKNGFSVSYKRS